MDPCHGQIRESLAKTGSFLLWTPANFDPCIYVYCVFKAPWFEGVMKCKVTDTLSAVVDKIVRAEVHRLIIVDDSNYVAGIVSLSDILNFLILKPMGE
jgi:hypothetical protein